MRTGAIELDGVGKSYGEVQALQDVNLSVEPDELVVFIGPSGCGKSTLLRMNADLEEISSGVLKIDGQVMNSIHPAKREVGTVFQSFALYPHMTVAQNVGFSVKLAKHCREEIDKLVRQVAEALQIEDLVERKPAELSDGLRQRVAIGGAIVRNPNLLLFDEPLSNLDAASRVHMGLVLERLRGKLDTTTIYVMHDQIEAMALAVKMVVLHDGRVQQVVHRLNSTFVPPISSSQISLARRQ